MDKQVCTKCRRNRRMTTDFDHGWCNSCVIDLKLNNIQLEAENEKLKEIIHSCKEYQPFMKKSLVKKMKALEGKK